MVDPRSQRTRHNCAVTQRLFFDCDTGIDDSLALIYLLARTDVDLVGVASTAGNVPVDVVTANKALLATHGTEIFEAAD